ncbi:MAG TPA: hypothetical protein VNN72_27670 [Polyangiaceae bacterium]|nr:hypothetical protein [Polyangiaceae bacterium]
MRMHWRFMAATALVGAAPFGCSSSQEPTDEPVGEAEVKLTNAPADASCLRVTVTGSRTDVRTFPLNSGEKARFSLTKLPVGTDTFTGEAFPVACNKLTAGVNPTWVSEPVVEAVKAGVVSHVTLLMIHNGSESVAVDFSESNAPTPPSPVPLEGGIQTTAAPYLVPISGSGVQVHQFLTTGDSPNLKPDGVTPYRMAGLPDGLGAYDNGDGTFTLLSNHEMPSATAGIARAHGGKGAFVSKWTIRKADLNVLEGEDLIQHVFLWNPATSAYAEATAPAFGRFCSADLPEQSALYDAASGLGYDGRLFFDGEETGNEGRGMVHALDGTSWEVPRAGKMSFENSVANPGTGKVTVVASLDDTTPTNTATGNTGEVYFYYGTKTNAGLPVDKAGLTNGDLYGLRVVGVKDESTAAPIATGPFELYKFGNVEAWTGQKLSDESRANNVTGFNRPEDGAWDPNDTNDFYFVTTAAFSAPSRLWRARFTNAARPDLGGTFENLLDGSEGHHMFDNITIDQFGHVYLCEDVGGNDHLGKVWRYDIASDTLTMIMQHNPDYFGPGGVNFLTNDEEASGVIDAADVLAPGWFLIDVQNHKASADVELVEGGQYLAFFDPASK